MAKNKTYTKNAPAALLLAESLKALPSNWVMCRDVRHAWSVLNDFHVTGKQGGFPVIQRELVCMRCETVRYEWYEQTKVGLDKVGQSYGYPEGYQIPGVPRGVKPQSIVQQEQYRRAMEAVAGAKRGETERPDA